MNQCTVHICSLLHAVLFGALHTFHAQLHQKINLVVVMMFTNRQNMRARSFHLLGFEEFFIFFFLSLSLLSSQTFLQHSLVHIIYKCLKIMLSYIEKKCIKFIEKAVEVGENHTSACLSRWFCFLLPCMRYSVTHTHTQTFTEILLLSKSCAFGSANSPKIYFSKRNTLPKSQIHCNWMNFDGEKKSDDR